MTWSFSLEFFCKLSLKSLINLYGVLKGLHCYSINVCNIDEYDNYCRGQFTFSYNQMPFSDSDSQNQL